MPPRPCRSGGRRSLGGQIHGDREASVPINCTHGARLTAAFSPVSGERHLGHSFLPYLSAQLWPQTGHSRRAPPLTFSSAAVACSNRASTFGVASHVSVVWYARVCAPPVCRAGRLQKSWLGLDWIGLDWVGLGWVGLAWLGLDCVAINSFTSLHFTSIRRLPAAACCRRRRRSRTRRGRARHRCSDRSVR